MEELGQLKGAEVASVRRAEGEGGDEALAAEEGETRLVSNRGWVRCVVLYLCVIPMRMHDATGVAANVGEQHRYAQQSADDRWQCGSSYAKHMHSVLFVRSVHPIGTILSIHYLHYVRVSDVC